MTDKMREEFETWFKKSLAQLVRCQALTEAASFEDAKPLLLLSWEESRESLVIDLPNPRDTLAGPTLYAQFKEAVEAVGVKVAPIEGIERGRWSASYPNPQNIPRK